LNLVLVLVLRFSRTRTSTSTLIDRGNARFLAKQARNFARLGMATEREFAKDQVVVDGDLKAPAARRQQGQRFNVGSEFGEQLVRQTDGAWSVVSLGAIFNGDVDFLRCLVHDYLLKLMVRVRRRWERTGAQCR
jgi:hypothetical protein